MSIVKLNIIVLHETDDAYRIEDVLGNKYWLLKSQVKLGEKTIFGYEMLCPRWLAEKHEIPYRSMIEE